MKTSTCLMSIILFLTPTLALKAQENNLVMNGSFENTQGKVHSPGDFILADSISSSNNTTVDLYSKDACGKDYHVPANYMGTQESKTGNNYAGIIAYYADDAGIFVTKPGYRKYSEYIQLTLREPLLEGTAYTISFNISLAEKSAYAVSGIGIYFSPEKMDVRNNSFLEITPYIISTDIIASTEWTTFTGTYVANGHERYLTLGCFDKYMEILKIAAPNTNNSRKAYYYIDDVGLTPKMIAKEDITMILSGSCYQLNNLNFEKEKAVILPGSYEELGSLVSFLKTYPYIVMYIDGHTDKSGTNQYNNKLSEERAIAVKTYLTDKGINKNRMKARGHGESQPIDMQNESSLTNRRVEITICAAPADMDDSKLK